MYHVNRDLVRNSRCWKTYVTRISVFGARADGGGWKSESFAEVGAQSCLAVRVLPEWDGDLLQHN